MHTRGLRKQLRDEYGYPGFYPSLYVEIAKWDADARVVRLTRRSKKRYVELVARRPEAGTTARHIECGIYRALEFRSFWSLKFAAYDVSLAAW